jgi:hypothetical protein
MKVASCMLAIAEPGLACYGAGVLTTAGMGLREVPWGGRGEDLAEQERERERERDDDMGRAVIACMYGGSGGNGGGSSSFFWRGPLGRGRRCAWGTHLPLDRLAAHSLHSLAGLLACLLAC